MTSGRRTSGLRAMLTGVRRLVAIAALLAAGCGSSKAPAKAPAPARASKPVAQRCGDPQTPATAVHLKTADGVTLDGVELGSGRVGAIFLHESPGDLCVWWPFAPALAKAGIHALLLDQRCFGQSACPTGAQAIDPAADVAAAIEQLRKHGATQVVLVGASYGGASALVAASKLNDQLDGVASLSGEADLNPQLDVDKVIPHLRAPLLLAVSTGDGYVSPEQMRTMLRTAGSKSKRLIVRPRDAGHGVQLLVGDDGVTPNAMFDTLVRFIRSP
jgi:hypothetical protein